MDDRGAVSVAAAAAARTRDERPVRPRAHAVVTPAAFGARVGHAHRLGRGADARAEVLRRAARDANQQQAHARAAEPAHMVRVAPSDRIRGAVGEVGALAVEAVAAAQTQVEAVR